MAPRCPPCKLQIHPIALVLIFLGLLVWVVALGGLAATTHYCYSNNGSVNTTIIDGGGNSTIVTTPGGCVSAYAFPWWAVWFELFILVGMLATCFIDAFEKGRFIFLAYLAMESFFLTVSARDFINTSVTNSTSSVNFQNYNLDAYYASAAGCILLAIVNYALIIFIGLGATTDMDNIQMPAMPNALNKWGIGGPRQQKYESSSTQGF